VAELEKVRDEFRQGGLNYQLSQRTSESSPAPQFSRSSGGQHDGEAAVQIAQTNRGRVSEREIAELGTRLSKSEYDGYARGGGRGHSFSGDRIVLGEQYEPIVENSFLSPLSPTEALSTFSIDVDTASYANVRRFLNEGRLPPPAAVRIEELVNYFTYSYPQPTGREPFSVNMETAECPWNTGHLLLRVGLKGKEVHRTERPPSNLTFLLDVSGSMQDANKLPLLKTTLMMFVAELTENDRVSIVTYAGDAGLRLPPTRGNKKEKIMAAIDSLSAGGSTHGSAGIQLAYEQAGQYFLKDGTNRVILATDGDLNVGVTSDDALVELIKEKAAGGTFLTVLGFGTGNLKDGKLEKLADNGNGVYAYIDGVREGRKVLVEQMSGSLVTIAKDVKIQIEFNPAQIASYRLLGYENRVLAAADFSNDRKDAGEIGAGHTVTALYELVPVGTKEVAAAPQVGEPLKYQATGAVGNALRGVPGSGATPDSRPPAPDSRLTAAAASGELLTLKLRYKEPDGIESRLVEFPLKDRGGSFHSASKDFQFAAAVASFGMILRGSEHRGSGNLHAVAEIAGGAIDADPSGYRAEFVDLVRKAQALSAK
jgi:Ca-activated chloride channel family protein